MHTARHVKKSDRKHIKLIQRRISEPNYFWIQPEKEASYIAYLTKTLVKLKRKYGVK